ncbi:protein-export membrane protein SecF [Candidatus Uhrbacteria bacterium RIFOXYB12_FULL_58_10]|uniref:Protein-export membrane protein SecF n=1 Tax=Candidatus Uhrbacteria bacterium RIFOXYB2_FULL_57_15 TaxID=1802422 RepID=A0A1F7W750_9BACT|nr:MAG: protein-export membrane protein SecF [Candidatus Uhrbacteria bacterium RIFOXYB12_FULL_58_10]OGL98476.1 MAG: protein-export membrane protein SecF [Candidatus Uhrbacteria bacterium RIFOXYB2_FULL_57_15]OGL99209.1 MAG: protein-export membrane protein SecF [Candidatus Uhrbacteria bacterium RIFOXYC12_FULL_57_11]
MTFSFVGLRRLWFGISAVLVVISLLAIATFGLRFSIDFVGGSLMELSFDSEAPATPDLTSALAEAGYQSVTVQSSTDNRAIIRLESLSEERHQEALSTIESRFGSFTEERFDSIGPIIGKELRKSAIIGVILTLTLIGLYISWTFRKVSDPVASWKYGLLTVICAGHDVIIPLGVFAILGHFLNMEIGAAFIAAILTILGYSISDTVVVFDRTRENLSHHTGESFADIVEKSVRQTYVRSINTSVTTLLVLVAILIFGGDSTRAFALALFIGIFVGTYSSIFFASPALVEWELRRSAR